MDALELTKYFVLEKQNVRSEKQIPFFPNEETESQDVRRCPGLHHTACQRQRKFIY